MNLSLKEEMLHLLGSPQFTKEKQDALFHKYGVKCCDRVKVLREMSDELERDLDGIKSQLGGIDSIVSMQESFHRLKTMGVGQVMNLIETNYSKVFSSAYPRRFEIPTGFFSPKRLAVPAFWAMHEWCEWKDQKTHLEIRDANSNKVVSSLIEKQVPTYFVSKAIMQALINTDLPKDFQLKEMPWPMDALLFALPEKTLTSAHGDITLLAIVKCTNRSYSHEWMNWGAVDHMVIRHSVAHEGPDTACILAMTDSGKVFQWEAPLDATSIHDASLIRATEGELQRLGEDGICEETEEIFVTQNLPRTAFQIILAMLACPEMVEVGTIVRAPSQKKGKVKCALWSPNFFGKAYRRHDQVAGESENPQQRRAHWRRGHFRHQRFGVGNTSIRVLWIQPMLINKNQLLAA